MTRFSPLLAGLALVIVGPPRSPADEFHPAAQETIIASDARFELLWSEGEFTEGPTLAPDGAIVFTDIGDRIMRFDPATRKTTVFRAPSGRANGLMYDPRGRLFACEGANSGGGRRISVTETDGRVRTLADRFQGKRFNSPNDLALDGQGRVYFTDPRYVGNEGRELDYEAIFLVAADGGVTLATREVQKPNGILVAADGQTVFVADTNSDPKGNHQLVSFRVNKGGTLGDKRVMFDFGADRAGIDGMTFDAHGDIFATAGRGDRAGIYVFSPAGKHLAFLKTPGVPTNCVFGGGQEKHVLYVTASVPPQAASGNTAERYGLYRIATKVSGAHPFAAEGPRR